MRQGFVKVAAVTPKIRVADTGYNAKVICQSVKEAAEAGAKVIVLPELCITGYTCGDLFLQEKLLREAKEELLHIAAFTTDVDAIIFVGLPLAYKGKLYNVAAALNRGKILGIVPKTYLPNYNEFYEARHFTRGMEEVADVRLTEELTVPMGTRQLFTCLELPELVIAAELCEDLWTMNPPSIGHAMHGATLIVNLSASDETTGKPAYRRELVKGQSARLLCGYIYASAGDGESTQDVVYSGHNLIAENGRLLAESELFDAQTISTEIDVSRLASERRRMTTFETVTEPVYRENVFSLQMEETKLTRYIDPMPFVPSGERDRTLRCEEILSIQSMGLKKRLEHTHCKSAVIGISGGLDSTLALLVTVRAFDALGMDHSNIKAVTMPGFGTTDRTYDNAVSLIRCLGADFIEVDIKTLVRHLVRYYADTCGDETLKQVLLDVLDTPVSPELLPPEDGKISQKTEDLVGPYELHDFYLYHMLRLSYAPAKVYRLAKQAFAGTYDDATIFKWLETFYRRFFAQQFKRSCLPDGPKVGSVAVSPRGDLRMPSDACASIWLAELEELKDAVSQG